VRSIILSTATRGLLPLLLLFSVFLFLRGHNAPGGGFIAGLVAVAAFALLGLTEGVEAARRTLFVGPRTLIGGGLTIATASGLAGLAAGRPFLAAAWTSLLVPGLGEIKLGTPLLFDFGVMLVVMGFGTMILFSLAED
jgi:multicomponent Na+:H+ antiporter subunit B